MRAAILSLLLLGLAGVLPGTAAQPKKRISSLYLPAGRGYDWSRAGYGAGKHPPYRAATFNVKTQFGAKGDGRTDDTRALQRAVAAACDRRDGGVVYLPAGTYILRKPIEIRRPNVVIRGAGRGSTRIYIPRSLSQVFGRTWVSVGRNFVKSPWSHGGAFITFRGTGQKSRNERTLLTTISADMAAHSRRIPVASSAAVQVGQMIRVFANDRSTGRPAGVDAAGEGQSRFGNVTLSRQQAPAWVQQTAAYQGAMDALLTSAEAGEGVSVAQAVAVDAASAVTAGAVGAAAAPRNSIVAWVYAGLADTGAANQGIVETDALAASARVVAKGRGWIQVDREIPFPVLSSRGWKGRVHAEKPTVYGCGIERLTIAFPHTAVGPHWTDAGYNAIEMNQLADSWVRDVSVINADNALMTFWVDRSTFTGVTVTVSKPRWNPRSDLRDNGHQAILVATGHSNLVTRFNIAARYIHDLAVTGTSLTVFEGGSGVDINCDHHRQGPWGNLFTDIVIGKGSRPFWSGGGKGRGANAGQGTTFWNLRRAGNPRSRLELPKCSRDFGAGLSFMGVWKYKSCPSMRWLVWGVRSNRPRNLYRAQLQARRTGRYI
ncbi:band 7 [Micractinium conductrix]|uniref:Band 7 n=1 Tax=Micractinium conductrix TaxID=554055 RepID=A0A2P6VIM0_9CHLO|nr:band 7 [Micractinium conductrix]|eukprot:PSC73918.1 band 7 [Micractinium conductrix]